MKLDKNKKMEQQLNELIMERRTFEQQLYDYLINNTVFVYFDEEEENEDLPENFWEPVIVNLSINQLDKIETIDCVTCECIICAEIQDTFKRVKCCKKSFCTECAENWFGRSVFCPFCKQDQRNII